MRHSNGNGNGNGHHVGVLDPGAAAPGLEGRLMPQNVEAEQAVIGAVLIDNEIMHELAPFIRPTDFYRAQHSFIFEAMLQLHDTRQPIDYVTTVEQLAKVKATFAANNRRNQDALPPEWVDTGIDYLAGLAERVPTSANAPFYASQVRTRSILRQLIGTTVDINRDCFDFAGDLGEFIDGVQRRVDAVCGRVDDGGRKVLTFRDALAGLFDQLDTAQGRSGSITGVPTGFIDFDEMTGGLQSGELIVVGARPSMGKTSWMTSAVRYAAVNEGIPVAVFTAEVDSRRFSANALIAEARINSRCLRTGQMDEAEYGRMVRAASKLADAPLHLDDTPGIGLRELTRKARKLRRDRGIQAVFVDYLQLLTVPGSDRRVTNREQEVATISRGLKALARELDIPVVVMAQLNRDVEKRSGTHRPRMSDLRESGSIEQDADVIALLHREHYYTRDEEDLEKAELIVAKQRNGPTGTAMMRFRAEWMRFDNPDDDHGGVPLLGTRPGGADDPPPGTAPLKLYGGEFAEDADRNHEPKRVDDDDEGSPFDYGGGDLPSTIA